MPAKPKPDTKKLGHGLDDASREMMFNGMNLSELGRLFHMDHRVLVEKLHGIKPSGRRGNANTYLVHEVAPYLVKPLYDIEEYIKRMNHSELPKMVSKEFWAGLRARQEYRMKEGELWETASVVAAVGELYKLVKMNLVLMVDAIGRSTEMSDRQIGIVRGLTDGALADLRQNIIDNFSGEAFNVSSEAVQTDPDEI